MMIASALLASLVLTPVAVPEEYVEKIPGSTASFKMIRVPAGSVEVEGKPVPVKSLFVAETELSWEVFDVYAFRFDLTEEENAKGVDAEARPSKPYGAPDRGFGHAGYPAIGMTFHSAQMFCQWLSKKTGKTYRLATEAEWIYLAHANGFAYEPLGEFVWHRGNANFKTHPNAKKKPNAFGLHDLLGNVAEWTVAADGTGVVMGGSYLDPADRISPSLRQAYIPRWQQTDPQNPKSRWWLSDGPMVGMRVVREP